MVEINKCMRNSKIHRQIYKKFHGTIPKDSEGRSYEVHHIDGNHENNDIANLKAVSLQEHYDIHYQQGDYYACWMIARKLKVPPEELSRIAKLSADERVKNKTHHLLKENREKVGFDNSKHANDSSKLRIELGTHNFLGSNNPSYERVKKGTHHLLGGSVQKKQIAEGKHASQVQWTCEVCKKTGRGKGNYTMYHGINCKKGKENDTKT